MSPIEVAEEQLIGGIGRLGIGAGDVIFVHSSLRSFGRVRGGAQTVVRSLLKVVGDQGSVVAPIFRTFFWDGPEQVWDRQNSPSLMGAISEAVRTWPGAVPSRHAPHPVAAIGPVAEDLAARVNRTDFSFDSPFSRLLELDTWILLLGVDFSSCTFVHLLEERTAVPYREVVQLTGTVVDCGHARRETYPFLRRCPGVRNDFAPLGKLLADAGKMHQTRIGAARVRACRARDLYDTGMRALRGDPLFLVSAGTRDLAARTLPDVGRWVADMGANPGRLPEDVSHPLARRLSARLHVRRGDRAPRKVERLVWRTDDDLTLRELWLEGGPSPRVPAMLAMPAGRRGPLPAIICLHGSGGTWERMMEDALRPRDGCLLGWARALARQGFAVLAVTQLSHPPRPEPWDWDWPKLLQLFGQTAMGRLVADVRFCVDYLHTVPGIDPERIGVAGFSLGGIAAFYSFVVDPRLHTAAVFCGGVGSLAELVKAGKADYHSVYYYTPGVLAAGLDHPDLVTALVPRPLLLCATQEDRGMPVAGVRRFAAVARSSYGAVGADGAFRLHMDPGPHAMTPAAFQVAREWFCTHMGRQL